MMPQLLLSIVLGIAALPVWAVEFTGSLTPEDLIRLDAAEIVIVGEYHDNPIHHAVQAKIAERIGPSAIVFEMLTKTQVMAISPENRNSQDELQQALNWDTTGWPVFGLYYPIIAAANEARIYGAQLDREAARRAFGADVTEVFGTEAGDYGLTVPLPQAQQSARETLQAEAHCDALPEDLLPGMVTIQRLRDAMLARAAIRALSETGGPVLVITGNGHARADWGIPVYIQEVKPVANVFALGQGEDDIAPRGVFDAVVFAPAPDREDPCAAFK